MMRKTFLPIAMSCCVILLSATSASSQVKVTVATYESDKITIAFNANFRQVDADSLAKTYLTFEDPAGMVVQLRGDVKRKDDNAIEIMNIRDVRDPSATPVHLAKGGGNVTRIPAKETRTYTVMLKGVQLIEETKAKDKPIPIEVSSPDTALPQIFMTAIKDDANIEYDRQIIQIAPFGLNIKRLLDRLKSNPAQARVFYSFSKSDISAVDFETSATSVRGDPDDNNPTNLILELGRALPRRPEKYGVKLKLPAQDLIGAVTTDAERGPLEVSEGRHWTIPTDTEFLEVSRVADLIPPKVDRASSVFYFETTFTSAVNPKDGTRGNVGIFGIHLKPTLPILTYNVYGKKQKPGEPPQDQQQHPVWMAFRPLLEADFDTQSPKVSKSPNRVMFGMDFELGRDAGMQGVRDDGTDARKKPAPFLQQLVWINGVRYDSDRDFKLQTMYWHTEMVPRFLNFEMTQEQRLFQHITKPDVKTKQPTVSSYRVRPSVGYELGGTVRRNDQPTDRISRAIVGLDLAVEFYRLIKLSATDTYYFLENAPRRRNRNYLETRFDINTGHLFNIDLAGLQNAITFKFQRGDQPPTFGPVNAFSVGFKVFQ